MLLAYGQLALSMALVGANIALGKLVVAVLPVATFSTFRFAIGCLILVPLVASRERLAFRLSAGEWWKLFLISFYGVFLFSLCVLHGVRLTSAVAAGVITATIPAAVAVLSALMLGERIDRRGRTAVALAVLGIAALTLPGAEAAGTTQLGNALILGAVVCEALYTVYAKGLIRGLSPLKLTLGLNLIGLALFAPLSAIEIADIRFADISPGIWGLATFYTLSNGIFCLVLWFAALRHVPAHVAGLFTAVLPVATTAVAIAVLGEAFTLAHALGLAVVVAAIAVGTRRG